MNVEGLAYQSIDHDCQKQQHLDKLRNNMPRYWMKTKAQKNHHFRQINSLHQEHSREALAASTEQEKGVSFLTQEYFKGSCRLT